MSSVNDFGWEELGTANGGMGSSMYLAWFHAHR